MAKKVGSTLSIDEKRHGFGMAAGSALGHQLWGDEYVQPVDDDEDGSDLDHLMEQWKHNARADLPIGGPVHLGRFHHLPGHILYPGDEEDLKPYLAPHLDANQRGERGIGIAQPRLGQPWEPNQVHDAVEKAVDGMRNQRSGWSLGSRWRMVA